MFRGRSEFETVHRINARSNTLTLTHPLTLTVSLCMEQTEESQDPVLAQPATAGHGAPELMLPDVNAMGDPGPVGPAPPAAPAVNAVPAHFGQNGPNSMLPPLGPPAVNTVNAMNGMNGINGVNAVNAVNAVPGLPVLGPPGNLDWFGHDENVNTLNANDPRFELNHMFSVCSTFKNPEIYNFRGL